MIVWLFPQLLEFRTDWAEDRSIMPLSISGHAIACWSREQGTVMSFCRVLFCLVSIVASTVVAECLVASDLSAGFRYSSYGPDYDPGPEYWVQVGNQMAGRFAGAVPGAIWIVGQLDGDGTWLNFPANPESSLIQASTRDGNERALLLFDRLGAKVWLQVEPGNAPVDELIDLVLDRYGHHSSVVGVGIDVEWYRSVDQAEGQAVTDAEARSWLARARYHDPSYRIFLKHWEAGKMPPTAREGILFVDDSQILPSFDAMVEEFAEWGRAFAPAPVAFQFGYRSDRPWWRHLQDPPREIGERILAAVPNAEGLYWVDFTVLEVFPPDPIVGVKIYDHAGEFEELFDRWMTIGINTAFVSEALAENEAFRREAKLREVPVFIITPVFFNPEVLAEDPNLFAVDARGQRARDDWVEFVCPSRPGYRQHRRQEIVSLVKDLQPQGVSLDFIRHFAFWERVTPDAAAVGLPNTCFCSHCVETFSQQMAIEMPRELVDTVSISEWILDRHGDAWIDWKIELITSMVEEIVTAIRQVDPGIRVNLHLVPWRRDDFGGALRRIAGQDLESLSRQVDYLSPMTYWFMLERPYTWVRSVVREMASAATVPILPSVQVEAAYREDVEITVDEFWLATHAALETPSRGVVFWSWEALARNPDKIDVLQEALDARSPRHREGAAPSR